jgi:predicted metal-dependent HD superfamily phosphohydrolase
VWRFGVVIGRLAIERAGARGLRKCLISLEIFADPRWRFGIVAATASAAAHGAGCRIGGQGEYSRVLTGSQSEIRSRVRRTHSYDVSTMKPNHPFSGAHPSWGSLLAAGFSRSRIDSALAFYDEAHRVYHDRRHIEEMMLTARSLGLQLSAAQSLALLFHDVVYVPGAAHGANEMMSAQLMRVYAAGLTEVLVEEAAAIVLDTAEHRPTLASAKLVIDLDLIRLGADEPDFSRHTEEVFHEVSPVLPRGRDDALWHDFAARRAAFLERLLARPRIFQLPQLFERYEAAARANLRRAIDAVTAPDSRGMA